MRWQRCVLAALFFAATLSAGAAHKRTVKVESTPPDALVSVHKSETPAKGEPRTVAGPTPITKEFDFGKKGSLWLQFEKRGYVTKTVEITPDKDIVSVTLDKLESGGKPAPEYVLPQLEKLAIATDVQVFHHTFTKDTSSPEEASTASAALAASLRDALATGRETSLAVASPEDGEAMKPVWRDVHGQFEVIDPIRLRYLPAASLETRSAREAALKVRDRTGADFLLLMSVRQTVESGGMAVGKTAILTAGTAASYAGGYANAVSNHQSFFVYTVYLPAFANGAAVNSALIDCRTGEIVWANRGLWKPLHFDNPAQLKEVVNDLLIGLPK